MHQLVSPDVTTTISFCEFFCLCFQNQPDQLYLVQNYVAMLSFMVKFNKVNQTFQLQDGHVCHEGLPGITSHRLFVLQTTELQLSGNQKYAYESDLGTEALTSVFVQRDTLNTLPDCSFLHFSCPLVFFSRVDF